MFIYLKQRKEALSHMDDKTVANLINELIGDHSRQEFSKKAGVKPMSITRWTNGTKINLVDFEKLCLAAGRKMHEVLNFEGVTDSLQKEFNVPEEYSLSIKELLKELLELQQENYQSQNSDNFIKLFTRNIRETKETLRSMKAKPERWLSISDWTEKISPNSSIKLIIPRDPIKENLSRYSVVFELTIYLKNYYCSYATKGGGTTWSYLRSVAHQMMVNKVSLSAVQGVIPCTDTWHKLWNKQYEGDSVMGQFVYYDENNPTLNAFIELVSSYFSENNYSE